MSCLDAPINITTPEGTCELKCEYNFDYKESSVILRNEGKYVGLSYDMTSSPQVIYNANNYQVREARLYIPSIHKYQGSQADAELIVVHSSANKNLIVSVPIMVGNSNTKTTNFLNQVAEYISKFAANQGDTAGMGNATWNLNDWVPEKKFNSYNGTAPYAPCARDYDYVVFNKYDSVSISSKALATLKKHIKSSGIRTKNNTFYTSTKVAKNSLDTSADDDIYISCSPTSISDEKEVVGGKGGLDEKVFKNIGEYFEKGEILNNPITLGLISIVLMAGIYKVGTLAFGKKRTQ